MHHRSLFLSWTGIALFATAISAQSKQIADSARREIDISMAEGNVPRLERTVAFLERAVAAYPGDGWLNYYLGFAYYRSATAARGLDDKSLMKRRLDEAERALQKSLETMPLAETHALLSSVYGLMIGDSKNPLTGMRYGPKADKALDKALALGPTNPRVWAIRASSVLFKPKLFGGSVVKAEEYARAAIGFLSNDRPASPAPTWGAADAYVFLGQALVAQKKYADARIAYERVLTLEPGNGWVKYVLMPELNRQQGQTR